MIVDFPGRRHHAGEPNPLEHGRSLGGRTNPGLALQLLDGRCQLSAHQASLESGLQRQSAIARPAELRSHPHDPVRSYRSMTQNARRTISALVHGTVRDGRHEDLAGLRQLGHRMAEQPRLSRSRRSPDELDVAAQYPLQGLALSLVEHSRVRPPCLGGTDRRSDSTEQAKDGGGVKSGRLITHGLETRPQRAQEPCRVELQRGGSRDATQPVGG